MVVTLYQMGPSPPCRVILMTAKAIGLSLNIKNIDLLAGANRTPEFEKLNPQRTIPVMEDNSFVLTESRAIIEYLCDSYAKTDALYPKNIKKRAEVNSRLSFEATTLHPRIGVAYAKMLPMAKGVSKPDGADESLKDCLTILDKLIGDNGLYLALNTLTIADISTVVTISNLEVFNFDFTPYKNITRWFNNAKTVIPGYNELNQKQIEVIIEFMKNKEAAA